MAGPRRILSLDDFERAARAHLPRPIFAYVSGAVEDNLSSATTARRSSRSGFVPRVLVDVSGEHRDRALRQALRGALRHRARWASARSRPTAATWCRRRRRRRRTSRWS
jgi:hypothetical protein